MKRRHFAAGPLCADLATPALVTVSVSTPDLCRLDRLLERARQANPDADDNELLDALFACAIDLGELVAGGL